MCCEKGLVFVLFRRMLLKQSTTIEIVLKSQFAINNRRLCYKQFVSLAFICNIIENLTLYIVKRCLSLFFNFIFIIRFLKSNYTQKRNRKLKNNSCVHQCSMSSLVSLYKIIPIFCTHSANIDIRYISSIFYWNESSSDLDYIELIMLLAVTKILRRHFHTYLLFIYHLATAKLLYCFSTTSLQK